MAGLPLLERLLLLSADALDPPSSRLRWAVQHGRVAGQACMPQAYKFRCRWCNVVDQRFAPSASPVSTGCTHLVPLPQAATGARAYCWRKAPTRCSWTRCLAAPP